MGNMSQWGQLSGATNEPGHVKIVQVTKGACTVSSDGFGYLSAYLQYWKQSHIKCHTTDTEKDRFQVPWTRIISHTSYTVKGKMLTWLSKNGHFSQTNSRFSLNRSFCQNCIRAK